MRRWVSYIAVVMAALSNCALAAGVDFSREVRPILAEHCFSCHGPDSGARKGDLRLDVLDPKLGPFAERDGYWIVKPGKLDDSVLVLRITSDDPDTIMPPPKANRPLSAHDKEILQQWVGQGAKWGKHWAFEEPVRSPAPAVKEDGWSRNPIDNFILARLEKEGIKHSPEADRATLLRRVSLDLIGLPPTVQEIEAFEKDTSEAAYDHAVDRLLASKHFGERWGRHWLDQARYADSNGYAQDYPRSIWPYRDWVINAINADMPFDQFVVEQLAGDMLPNPTLDQRIATGFHRNTQINSEGGIDPEQFRVESIIDRVATTGTVFLGLTVGCAQCHDHKFDPITQKEYYRLFAFFNNADEPTVKVTGVTDPKAEAQLRDRVAAMEAAVKQKVATWETTLTDAQRKTLKPAAQKALAVEGSNRDAKQQDAVLAALRSVDNDFGPMVDEWISTKKQLEEGATTMVMVERKEPRKTTLLIKGDYTRPSEVVTPGVPAVLPELKAAHPTRLDLAHWIVSKDNPLTARVAVNRIWQQYFGQGLVSTENDFGTQGSVPTHPELLDYLATELVQNGWSLKHIHRLIVTSATYRQSSTARKDLEEIDPYNKLLARQGRIRLDAEIVRDVALTASGLLNEKIGGPSVYPPIPPGVMGLGQVKHPWPTSTGSDRYRRGMYTFMFRNSLHPSLASFDTPDATAACTRRLRSNTPLQALNLLNDTAWMEFSKSLASRVAKESPGNDDQKVEWMFRTVTAREPSPDERQILENLLVKKRQAEGDSAAWTMLARVVLNLDEAITRE